MYAVQTKIDNTSIIIVIVLTMIITIKIKCKGGKKKLHTKILKKDTLGFYNEFGIFCYEGIDQFRIYYDVNFAFSKLNYLEKQKDMVSYSHRLSSSISRRLLACVIIDLELRCENRFDYFNN